MQFRKQNHFYKVKSNILILQYYIQILESQKQVKSCPTTVSALFSY